MSLQLPDFNQVRVLVVGDIMLDRYWHGGTSRISPEAPVPVVHIKQIEERPGGAGNVALNTASLSAKTQLIGYVGADEAGKTLAEKFVAAGVNANLLAQENFRTITKLRIISRQQQLIRLDFEEKLLKSDSSELFDHVKQALPNNNILILSDYGKGTLSQIEELIGLANMMDVPVLVDPKGHDFARYRGATLLTPNRKEFEIVGGNCCNDDELVAKARVLINQHQLEGILVTRGEEGMTLIADDQEALHLPAHGREVFDVTGAGDSVIATLAVARAAGMSWADAVRVANLAGSIVVGKMGASTVTVPELTHKLYQNVAIDTGVVNIEQLAIARTVAKNRGDRVVFTNGCFDLLHPGHITYLEQAKAQGDLLIVGVNDDASVKRLKGVGRPVNTLVRRMAVLAGLSAVDWVVPFDEDTPRQLIERLTPDVLVKGGDYEIEDIVGHEIVAAYGGEVKSLCFVENFSTTDVIKKIKISE